MINPQWLKLPMSPTHFHGSKDVQAIEVQLINDKHQSLIWSFAVKTFSYVLALTFTVFTLNIRIPLFPTKFVLKIERPLFYLLMCLKVLGKWQTL